MLPNRPGKRDSSPGLGNLSTAIELGRGGGGSQDVHPGSLFTYPVSSGVPLRRAARPCLLICLSVDSRVCRGLWLNVCSVRGWVACGFTLPVSSPSGRVPSSLPPAFC